MAFDAPTIRLAWLATLELPERTLRFSDGGQAIWGADAFRATDDEFGTIAEAEAPEERTGDDAPGASLTFLPESTAAAAALSSPSFQRAPFRLWLAEIDDATGEVTGTPELEADMELDTTTLLIGRETRKLEMGLIAAAERLFLINEGNALSPRHHKSIWPGEQGLDNATGKPVTVAWGTEGPPRGTTGAAAGGMSGWATSMLNAVNGG